MIRAGLISFSSCAGCFVEFLNMEEDLLDLVKIVDVRAFPIALEENEFENLDVLFVEGCPTTPYQLEELLHLRGKAKYLVALGTCACYGGVFTLIKEHTFKDAVDRQYGGTPPVVSIPPQGLSYYVRVDYHLYGCPFELSELKALVTALAMGKPYRQPEYDVCAECVLRDNDCLLNKGVPCMGPVIRGGCRARCPSSGQACTGCRGTYSDANIDSHRAILLEWGLTPEEIDELYAKYGGVER